MSSATHGQRCIRQCHKSLNLIACECRSKPWRVPGARCSCKGHSSSAPACRQGSPGWCLVATARPSTNHRACTDISAASHLTARVRAGTDLPAQRIHGLLVRGRQVCHSTLIISADKEQWVCWTHHRGEGAIDHRSCSLPAERSLDLQPRRAVRGQQRHHAVIAVRPATEDAL